MSGRKDFVFASHGREPCWTLSKEANKFSKNKLLTIFIHIILNYFIIFKIYIILMF